MEKKHLDETIEMNQEILKSINIEKEIKNSEYNDFDNYGDAFSSRKNRGRSNRNQDNQNIIDIHSIGELLYDIDENNEKIEKELKRTQEIILS